MAKIPTILEAGRADGKLVTSYAIFDENKKMFQSEINDIQDTLNSDNPNKPLSAKQGKILKDLLDSKVIEAGSVPIDTEPIEGNITHLVNSDGLAKEFNKYNTEIILGGVYDISSHNNGIAFESLQDLLSSSNLSTLIPTSVRHGGMSIRFVQSSDNKYVQARCMAQNFTTDITQWQGVDNEPTVGSENLIKSKGVFDKDVINGIYLNTSYYVRTAQNTACIVKGVKGGEKYYLYVENASIVTSDLRKVAYFADYTKDPDTNLGTFYYSSPETFYKLTVPVGATQMVICCHWTDGTGNSEGYHLLTADEYFTYLKEHNRAISSETNIVSAIFNTSSDFVGYIPVIFGENKMIAAGGNFVDFPTGHCKYTPFIKCKEGDIFNFIGTRESASKSWFFFDITLSLISTGQCVLSDTPEQVTIPSGISYVRFQSITTIESLFNNFNLIVNVVNNQKPLFNNINTLINKRIYWFGSSIIEGFGEYPYTNKYGWATPVANKYGAICDNQGHSGASYRDMTSSGRHCIVEDCINYLENLPSQTMVDYVIVEGGSNDRDDSNKWGTVNKNVFVDYPNNDMNYTTSALENLCSYMQNTERWKNTKFGVMIHYTINDVPNNPGWEPVHWNELADKIKSVCVKWGVPCLDMRECCGFTLCSENSRKIYGTDLTTFDGDYDPIASYSVDQRAIYNGVVYRAKQTITAPAGEWDSSKWTQVSDDNGYDRTHINRFAYDKTASLVANWIMSL